MNTWLVLFAFSTASKGIPSRTEGSGGSSLVGWMSCWLMWALGAAKAEEGEAWPCAMVLHANNIGADCCCQAVWAAERHTQQGTRVRSHWQVLASFTFVCRFRNPPCRGGS